METKKILTRENTTTDELYAVVEKVYKGINLEYSEAFYLDYLVDEDTGLINKDLKDKTYNYSLVKVALSSNDINVIPITINTDNKKFSLGTPDLETFKSQLFEEKK